MKKRTEPQSTRVLTQIATWLLTMSMSVGAVTAVLDTLFPPMS